MLEKNAIQDFFTQQELNEPLEDTKSKRND